MSQKGDFDSVRKDIVKLLHQPEYDDGSAGPVLVRLACKSDILEPKISIWESLENCYYRNMSEEQYEDRSGLNIENMPLEAS